MVYLNWFDALKSLLFDEQRARKLSHDQCHALYFLGNMFMPEETQIIRLGSSPKSFDRSVTALSQRPDLFGDGFYLPSAGVIVEDEISAIGFVDLDRSRPKGIGRQRLFLCIETKNSARKTRTLNTLGDLLDAALLELSCPEGTYFVMWGVIEDVTDMNIDGRPVGIQLYPWGFAMLDKDQLYSATLGGWFIRHLNDQQGGPIVDAAMEELIARTGEPLVQNLQFGLLQVAYANALVEAQTNGNDSDSQPEGEQAG